MVELFELREKVALVVGAGQGIGRACALMLARAGSDVALVDTVPERVAGVAEEVRAFGRRAVALEADVCDAAQSASLAERAGEALGRLDCLVNIVGQASWASLDELDGEIWQRDLALNLEQHWRVAVPVARKMRAAGRGGSLVAIASVSGLFAAPGHAAYGVAKAGLVALVKSMAEEWGRAGIRANAIAPGAVRTPRIEGMWERGEAPRPGEDVLSDMASPEDVAGAALFLCSGLSRRINGQTLVVDGGRSTRFPFDLA